MHARNNLCDSPGACLLSPHIVPHECGLPLRAVMASMKTRKLADGRLDVRDPLMGGNFTAPDTDLFVVAGWNTHVGVDIWGLPRLGAFMGRVAARPGVQPALKPEGLSKSL